MMSVWDLIKKKKSKEKITMVTCYDYLFAKILNESLVDILLVGDSAAMVMHGNPNTLSATTEMIRIHTAAVTKGAPSKLIVADMPFMSFRKGTGFALDTVKELMVAGAHAVKLEGVWGHEDVVKAIVETGVPVMGHVGLTPQSVFQMGGYKVQGKTRTQAEDVLMQAQKLQDLGCFSLVAECVPQALGKELSEMLSVPVIGIGAGHFVDGQVLVLHDLLGLNQDMHPRFVRKFIDGASIVNEAVNHYCSDVKEDKYPTLEESYL